MSGTSSHNEFSRSARREVPQDQRYVADWHRRSRREIVVDAVEAFGTDLRNVAGKDHEKTTKMTDNA